MNTKFNHKESVGVVCDNKCGSSIQILKDDEADLHRQGWRKVGVFNEEKDSLEEKDFCGICFNQFYPEAV